MTYVVYTNSSMFFYLTDDQNAINYILEFPNCYHQVKCLNQDKCPINKLHQTYELRRPSFFKKDQLRKVMCSYAIKVTAANRIFFAVFCLGPGVSFTLPHSNSNYI